jgi:hypothetical protein
MMTCSKHQILTGLNASDEDEEIEIEVSDDGAFVVISGEDFDLSIAREDFGDFIGACISADAYMGRIAKERSH